MKFISILAGSSAAYAAAVPAAKAGNPGGINYVQNYNGDAAAFKYDESKGTYSAKWNGNTDFVVGLGWNTGAAR